MAKGNGIIGSISIGSGIGSSSRNRGGMGGDIGVGVGDMSGKRSKGLILLQRHVNRWTQPGQGLGSGLAQGPGLGPGLSQGPGLGSGLAQGPGLGPRPTILAPDLLNDHFLRVIQEDHIPVKSQPANHHHHKEKDFIPCPTYIPALLPTSPPTKTSHKNKSQSIRL